MILVDTSAFLALLDMNDIYHEEAIQKWIALLEEEQESVTNNYIVVESISITQKGLACRRFKNYERTYLNMCKSIGSTKRNT